MNWIQDMWNQVQLTSALESVIEGVAGQMAVLLPVGVFLLGNMAGPRIVRRIFNAFI